MVVAHQMASASTAQQALLPIQLTALGVPPPGAVHWKGPMGYERRTLAAQRYPAIDFTPYDEAQQHHIKVGAAAATEEAKGGDPVHEQPPSLPSTGRWIEPQEPATLADTAIGGDLAEVEQQQPVLTPTQVQEFRDAGCVLVHGIWPNHVITAAAHAASEIEPLDQSARRPARMTRGAEGHDAARAFPFDTPALNTVTLHPRILTAVAQLLDVAVDELRLTQGALDGKWGVVLPPALAPPAPTSYSWGTAVGDQPMHCDYGNNTLLSPARSPSQWGPPDDVQVILYYDDCNDAGGPTAFVPGLRHTSQLPVGGIGVESLLYEVERYPKYKCGTALLYSLGCWHRGTPVLPSAVRRKHHPSFRTASAPYIGGSVDVGDPTAKTLFALETASDGVFSVARFLGDLSPQQRALLGFPPLHSTYWRRGNGAAITALHERYGGTVDSHPYAAAAARLLHRL